MYNGRKRNINKFNWGEDICGELLNWRMKDFEFNF